MRFFRIVNTLTNLFSAESKSPCGKDSVSGPSGWVYPCLLALGSSKPPGLRELDDPQPRLTANCDSTLYITCISIGFSVHKHLRSRDHYTRAFGKMGLFDIGLIVYLFILE
jgi:hypothetical protein